MCLKDEKFEALNSYIKFKYDGRLVFIRQFDIYLILVPVGYEGKETTYKNKVFHSLSEVEEEIYNAN